jgi:hypothetical protein
MPSIMFYERAVALNRERHQKLRIEVAPNHYSFAGKTNALPIASTEFADAARFYPLVGLRDRENLLVDADGQWEKGSYIPAFARRYPFVLAGTEGSDKFTVCVDEAYPGLNDERGESLFDDAGKESVYLNRVLEFLRLFHAEMLRTGTFATRLAELGLLIPKVITVERAGQKKFLEGLWIVDEEKLRGIDDARAAELFKSGYLHWISAHRLSLGNLARLAAKLDAQSKATGHEALEAETPAS